MIEHKESLVGTFHITQPGSSVATSLTAGEAVRKQVGILDIRGNQFKLTPIPLTQVRAFMMGEVSLGGLPELDPEDSKIDIKITRLLEEEIKQLVFEARSKREELINDCQTLGNHIMHVEKAVQYMLQKPNEVLVRLKVEHSGFSTLNNQRFGAKFVGDVANPVSQCYYWKSCFVMQRKSNSIQS